MGEAVAGPAGAIVGGIAGAVAGAVKAGNAKSVPLSQVNTAPPVVDATGKPVPGSGYIPLPSPKTITDWWQSHAPTWLGGLPAANAQTMRQLNPVISGLEKAGWSPTIAAGIAANVLRESGGRPNAVGDNGQAFGLAQWHADRQALFKKVFGHDIKTATVEEQTKFIDYELHHNEKVAGAALERLAKRTALSDQERAARAAAIISKYYERPAKTGEEMDKRAQLAAQINRSMKKTPVTNATQHKPAQVTVRNLTGGNVVVSVGALSGV